MSKYSTQEDKDKLEQACQHIENKAMSLRQASDWLTQQTGKYMSYEGLRKHIAKRKQRELFREEFREAAGYERAGQVDAIGPVNTGLPDGYVERLGTPS